MQIICDKCKAEEGSHGWTDSRNHRCGIDDEGAHRFRVSGDQYTVKIMALVRFIYETCGWEKDVTFRSVGSAP